VGFITDDYKINKTRMYFNMNLPIKTSWYAS